MNRGELKHQIDRLILDYPEKTLMQHIALACSNVDNLEFVRDKSLADNLDMYLNQLELDDQIRGDSGKTIEGQIDLY